MPDRKEFSLGDYVEVKDRIDRFYEFYASGRLVTEEVRATLEPDGVPRIWAKAAAYRTPDDPHPAIGWSWLELPGNTPYTKGSELENAETSAWGRAIAALGILTQSGIASRHEVESKAALRPPQSHGEPRSTSEAPNEPPEVSAADVAALRGDTFEEANGAVPGMTLVELQRRAKATNGTVTIPMLNEKAIELFGRRINLLTDEQRQNVAEGLGLA
jgi:hypothetical protein